METVEPKTQTVKVRAVNLGNSHGVYGLSPDLNRSIREGETFDAWLEDAIAADADRPLTMTVKDENGVVRTIPRRPGWMKRLDSIPKTVAVPASRHAKILEENAQLKAKLAAIEKKPAAADAKDAGRPGADKPKPDDKK